MVNVPRGTFEREEIPALFSCLFSAICYCMSTEAKASPIILREPALIFSKMRKAYSHN